MQTDGVGYYALRKCTYILYEVTSIVNRALKEYESTSETASKRLSYDSSVKSFHFVHVQVKVVLCIDSIFNVVQVIWLIMHCIGIEISFRNLEQYLGFRYTIMFVMLHMCGPWIWVLSATI